MRGWHSGLRQWHGAFRHWQRALPGFALLLLVGSCITGAPRSKQLVDLFEEAAYRQDRNVITRFEKSELTIALRGENGADSTDARTLLESRLVRLTELSGISFVPLDHENDRPDILVIFEPRTLVDTKKNFLCLVSYRVSDFALAGLLVRIGTQPAIGEAQSVEERIGRCIDHEMMHGIGFISHPLNSFLRTVMTTHQGTTQRARRWTESDELLIRAMYDPRLTSGMNREVAEPILREIFIELVAETQ